MHLIDTGQLLYSATSEGFTTKQYGSYLCEGPDGLSVIRTHTAAKALMGTHSVDSRS